MTFLELCELTYEKANRHPVAFSSVDLGKSGSNWIVPDPEMRAVIRAVQDAFDYILNLSSHWTFLQNRGKLLSLTAGVSSYSRKYTTLDWAGLYVRPVENDIRYPVFKMDYKEWEELEQMKLDTRGIPGFIIEAPQQKWILWPTPLSDMELWGDAQQYRPKLIDASDEPPWESDQHSIVSDVALRILEQRIDSMDQSVQQLNVQVSGQAVQHGIAGLIRDYTQGFG